MSLIDEFERVIRQREQELDTLRKSYEAFLVSIGEQEATDDDA